MRFSLCQDSIKLIGRQLCRFSAIFDLERGELRNAIILEQAGSEINSEAARASTLLKRLNG